MGRSLGRGMREFKDSVTNDSNDKNDVDETKLELTAATDTPVVVPERLADRTAA
jgi:Sec-independent protein translocase protein TatA